MYGASVTLGRSGAKARISAAGVGLKRLYGDRSTLFRGDPSALLVESRGLDCDHAMGAKEMRRLLKTRCFM